MYDLIAKPSWIICIALLVGLQLACGQTAPTPATSAATVEPALSPSANVNEAALTEPTQGEISSPAPPTQVEVAQPAPTKAETIPPVSQILEIAAGNSTHTMTFDGLERSYLLHIPPGYDPTKSSPLVLVYHGLTLDAEEMVRITGLSDLSDQEGFVVAYPNGTGSRRSWNGGACCADAFKELRGRCRVYPGVDQ